MMPHWRGSVLILLLCSLLSLTSHAKPWWHAAPKVSQAKLPVVNRVPRIPAVSWKGCPDLFHIETCAIGTACFVASCPTNTYCVGAVPVAQCHQPLTQSCLSDTTVSVTVQSTQGILPLTLPCSAPTPWCSAGICQTAEAILGTADLSTIAQAKASISSNGDVTLAIRDGGTIWFGGKPAFKAADGGTVTKPLLQAATQIDSVTGASAIHDGAFIHYLSGGTIWRFALNTTTVPVSADAAPQQFSTLSNVLELSVGEHACARTSAGDVWCWGRNDCGQVGSPTTFSKCKEEKGMIEGATEVVSVPTKVDGISDAVAIAVGGRHTCAVTATGALWCWGNNAHGELGVGMTPEYSFTPLQVLPLTASSVVSIAGLSEATCALTKAGHIYCWGDDDYFELGIEASGNQAMPVMLGIEGAVGIFAGDYTACALRAVGALSCWGLFPESNLPTDVATDVLAASVTDHHLCLIKTDNAIVCSAKPGYGLFGLTGWTTFPKK